MRRTFGIAAMLASAACFIAAFQNCAVYKSSQKSDFEGGGTQPVKSASIDKAASDAGPCAGLLAEGDADAAFGRPTELRGATSAAGEPACMVSTFENVADGADTAVCTRSAANMDLLRTSPATDDDRIVVDPDPSGPMALGSFGFASELDGGKVEFAFVGAGAGATEAAMCRFAYSSPAAMRASLALATARGSKLVRYVAKPAR